MKNKKGKKLVVLGAMAALLTLIGVSGSQTYAKYVESELGSTIYPKSVTAEQIVRYVRSMKNTLGSQFETMYTIIKGQLEAAEFKINVPSDITGKPISQLPLKKGVLIASIQRENTVILPRGNDTIEVGDAVVVVYQTMTLSDITDILK